MSKRKLIVFEGTDCVGKSTQVEIIKNRFNANQIRQPSGENLLGFLRDIVKNDLNIDAFPRQLLHSISHIVDAFTFFGGDNVIVMDRCHWSAFCYGEVTGLNEFQNELILKIHQNVYQSVLSNYDVQVIFIDRDSRIKDELTDNFEKSFNWEHLRDKYRAFHNTLGPDRFLFSRTENITRLDATNLSKEETTIKILGILNDC